VLACSSWGCGGNVSKGSRALPLDDAEDDLIAGVPVVTSGMF
jgi:hypothetical protein